MFLNIPNLKSKYLATLYNKIICLSVRVLFYRIGAILISYPHKHENCMWSTVDYKLVKAHRKENLATNYKQTTKVKRLKCIRTSKFYGGQNRSLCRICLFCDHAVRQITHFCLSYIILWNLGFLNLSWSSW